MAIEYIEIRNKGLDLVGIVDAATSIIWHSVYFGVGDFEIYTKATPEAVSLLQEGFYITRPDDIEVGIIEKINITDNPQDGSMIIAAGRFAKSILDRRLIYKLSGSVNTPTILRGNVEENARALVYDNAISCAFDSKRNMQLLELETLAGIPAKIVDENGYAAQKQVSYQNLLTYTDGFLEEYGLASLLTLDIYAKKLKYSVYAGIDRSTDNISGNVPIIFSQDFDNLTASEYTRDTTRAKNAALIGGAGEGIERFYSLLEGDETDLQRREVFIDASSINRTYKEDGAEEETEYTAAEYTALLHTKGKQDMSAMTEIESFAGTIDLVNGNWIYNRDFMLGDLVTVQDNNIGKYINVRIKEITEVQDENGYTIEAVYG